MWSGEILRFFLRLSTDWFYLTKQIRVFKNVCNHKDDLGVTVEFLNEEDTPGTREQTTRGSLSFLLLTFFAVRHVLNALKRIKSESLVKVWQFWFLCFLRALNLNP